MNLDVEKARVEDEDMADGVCDRPEISLGCGEGKGLDDEAEGEAATEKV